MREIRTYGSEGGAAQANAPFLPLSAVRCYAAADDGGLGETRPTTAAYAAAWGRWQL